MDNIRRGRKLQYSLRVELTFWALNRRLRLDEDAIERLRRVFAEVCEDFDSQLVDMRAEKDQVDLIIHYPPKWSVSALINSLKGVSSRHLREERPDIRRQCVKDALWSPSYLAKSVDGELV
jgi:putative transposase